MITSHPPMLDLAGSILYLAALFADQPRSIDHYIDYFGGRDRACWRSNLLGPQRRRLISPGRTRSRESGAVPLVSQEIWRNVARSAVF